MLSLHTLKKNNTKKKKRVGRGNASGHGTYSTRGIKGQRARSGGRKKLKIKGFKQILTNVPKEKGFKRESIPQQIINIVNINEKFKEGEKVNPETLFSKKLVKDKKINIKILAKGDLKIKSLNISGCELSESAKKKIEDMGGIIEIK
ncbi:50S ribosomal protein L15 [Patescibacteria group bacterium]